LKNKYSKIQYFILSIAVLVVIGAGALAYTYITKSVFFSVPPVQPPLPPQTSKTASDITNQADRDYQKAHGETAQ